MKVTEKKACFSGKTKLTESSIARFSTVNTRYGLDNEECENAAVKNEARQNEKKTEASKRRIAHNKQPLVRHPVFGGNDNEVTDDDDNEDDNFLPRKKNKKSIDAPRRRAWPADQVLQLRKEFAEELLTRKVPGRERCIAAMAKFPHAKTWTDIKFKIYNMLKH